MRLKVKKGKVAIVKLVFIMKSKKINNCKGREVINALTKGFVRFKKIENIVFSENSLKIILPYLFKWRRLLYDKSIN